MLYPVELRTRLTLFMAELSFYSVILLTPFITAIAPLLKQRFIAAVQRLGIALNVGCIVFCGTILFPSRRKEMRSGYRVLFVSATIMPAVYSSILVPPFSCSKMNISHQLSVSLVIFRECDYTE